VVEQNRDGQMYEILQLEMPAMATKLTSLAFLDGLPLTARWIVEHLLEKEKENAV
jgi:2-oxoglutarate/2-oxoacid ferredoxin oxidoreductase subunit alpha